MKLIKYLSHSGEPRIGQLDGDRVVPLDLSRSSFQTLADILEADDPEQAARSLLDAGRETPASDVGLLAPIDRQEVWAAGVTYQRSQAARMEESAAAASCYDRVYSSPRPELFFKANPHRVAGPGQPLRIRADSAWNVPEPEITLVLNSRLQLVGFTVGNDMSSRDIEGENPLYLPQAKVYNACCGLGPCITLAGAMPPLDAVHIRLVIRRAGEVVFAGTTSVAKMARSFEDLIQWLGRDNSFPNGAFLLTGTGIVPERDFTLQPGDLVAVSIDGIGTLTNPIVQGEVGT
ncbi:MAG TPA: fumarylacetoacetate hydrolase family protein [Candidatus Anammoximicrobium sp.]|nr:fumarylacetoacetate hydrolase family protein [Candidatus Anammoximicrobium sp.]